ncbi:predicted protein [Uncinocarpus reesii 1704]|uniref:Uncharacterized protein n=1 Tax=Uncinocarpus reesii (strain UAMH 1704) TaxID=336963 RepID=C4JPS6_UNCRE|nr:uncharacterized protein UREG_04569 [Uncinocarpus reesii 1704]EEP79723.1 predicted protein [Uncinocarpus reesii 1704]
MYQPVAFSVRELFSDATTDHAWPVQVDFDFAAERNALEPCPPHSTSIQMKTKPNLLEMQKPQDYRLLGFEAPARLIFCATPDAVVIVGYLHPKYQRSTRG